MPTEPQKRPKVNCWEYMGCSQSIGDDTPCTKDTCRARSETLVDGVNGGRNGGRACWAVSGSFSMDPPDCGQIGPASCVDCPFFRLVVSQELPNLEFAPQILQMLGYANIFGPASEDWNSIQDPECVAVADVE